VLTGILCRSPNKLEGGVYKSHGLLVYRRDSGGVEFPILTSQNIKTTTSKEKKRKKISG
jgi:hypothetical protein